MSPARTLLNTKYDLDDNRTRDTPFVCYRALYPLSRKATTRSSSSYDRASAWRRPWKSVVGKKVRCLLGNDANFECCPMIYSFKLCIRQDPRIARAYTAQSTIFWPLLACLPLPPSTLTSRCGTDKTGWGALEPPLEEGARTKRFDREIPFSIVPYWGRDEKKLLANPRPLINTNHFIYRYTVPGTRFPFGVGFTWYPGGVASPRGGTQAFQWYIWAIFFFASVVIFVYLVWGSTMCIWSWHWTWKCCRGSISYCAATTHIHPDYWHKGKSLKHGGCRCTALRLLCGWRLILRLRGWAAVFEIITRRSSWSYCVPMATHCLLTYA